jgi:hypothetical protein
VKFTTLLRKLGACHEATEWADTQPDLQTAWQNCQRSEWMLWLMDHTTVDPNDPRRRLMACDFAEAVLHLAPKGEDRPRKAVEVARRFANGQATEEELAAASSAARDAASSAAWAAAWAAACAMNAARDAAAAADWAAASAKNAARAAARAAASATSAAADWAAASARDAASDAQCEIIRNYFPECPEVIPPKVAQ